MSAKTKTKDLWFPDGLGTITGDSSILGIDASLTSTGICLLQGRVHAYSEALTNTATGPMRLVHLRDRLIDILESLQPAVACLEGYSYGSSQNREVVAEWGGLVRVALYELRIPVLIVAPTTLKKFVLDKPGSGKEMMMLASYKRWGVEFDSNDICDAHALAQLAACRIDLERGGVVTSTRMREAALTASPYTQGRPKGPARRR